MPNIIAIKTHYDHRSSLPHYLKYSRLSTNDEYQEYLRLFREENVGGDGFHECLNFHAPNNDRAKIYLPPTCVPARPKLGEEFIIFTFTYKTDQELPSSIVGVHAGAKFLTQDGFEREGTHPFENTEPLIYHAESPSSLVTLFTPAIQYNYDEGIHTPAYASWGNGLRYLNEQNALNILNEALDRAEDELEGDNSKSRTIALQRQIAVIKSIKSRYFNGEAEDQQPSLPNSRGSVPDKDIGHAGEAIVFNKELEFAESIGAPPGTVEWLSQSVPNSVFDIKSVRLQNGKLVEHYIEVKSSKLDIGQNSYISARQIDWFAKNKPYTSIALVTFPGDSTLPRIEYYSYDDFVENFELVPTKFKLRRIET